LAPLHQNILKISFIRDISIFSKKTEEDIHEHDQIALIPADKPKIVRKKKELASTWARDLDVKGSPWKINRVAELVFRLASFHTLFSIVYYGL